VIKPTALFSGLFQRNRHAALKQAILVGLLYVIFAYMSVERFWLAFWIVETIGRSGLFEEKERK
jgi:hypothetical protein